jgi:hypothetical protein
MMIDGKLFCDRCFQDRGVLIPIKEFEKEAWVDRVVCPECFKRVYLDIPEEIEITLTGRI